MVFCVYIISDAKRKRLYAADFYKLSDIMESEIDEITKEKIRNILTPDIQVCPACREKYKNEASCSSCGRNMLDPSYKGMVYECPLCGKLYCEECWNSMESGHTHEHEHVEESSGGLFNR